MACAEYRKQIKAKLRFPCPKPSTVERRVEFEMERLAIHDDTAWAFNDMRWPEADTSDLVRSYEHHKVVDEAFYLQ